MKKLIKIANMLKKYQKTKNKVFKYNIHFQIFDIFSNSFMF